MFDPGPRMLLEKIIKPIPLAWRVRRWLITALEPHASYESVLKALDAHPNPRAQAVKQALAALPNTLPPTDAQWVKQIEAERQRLLSRKDALNDGTRGQGEVYDQGVTVGQACKDSKPPAPALLLYLLVREIMPSTIVELGTNVGISTAFLAAALRQNGRGAKVVTLDASVYRQGLATDVHQRLGLDNIVYVQGLFNETLKPTLDRMDKVDMAFIDGHHQYRPTLDYFDAIAPFSKANALFVFDDLRWSDGMRKAWAELRRDSRLEVVVDLTSVGIGVRGQGTNQNRMVPRRVRLF